VLPPSPQVVGTALALALSLTHCGGDDLVLPGEPDNAAFRIQPLAGDQQSGVVGTVLSTPLAVRVTSDSGKPVEGVTVSWVAASGGSVSAATSMTDVDGVAKVLRTLGATPGPYATQAEAQGLRGSPVIFQATALGVGQIPPVTEDDEYETIEGFNNILEVSAEDGVLQNDVDPEGETLRATNPSDPENGFVTLNADGSFSYHPVVNFFGDDHFTYRARNEHGKSTLARVTIHVAPVNDPPSFTDGGTPPAVWSGGGPQRFDGWARDITPGAENENDQVLEFEVIANSNPGLFTTDGQPAVTRSGPESSDGALTFTPAGIPGVATISVVLKDDGGNASGGSDTSGPHDFVIWLF
jgi:Big-like domain-containing protein